MKSFVGLFAFALVVGCGSDQNVPVEGITNLITATAETPAAANMNTERRARGLRPLSPSAALQAAARSHAADMASNDFFSHFSSSGANVMDRVRRQGYRACFMAENIAQGQQTQAAALEAWMTSAPHRKNVLSPRATEFGVARAAASGGPVWVMVFGRPGC